MRSSITGAAIRVALDHAIDVLNTNRDLSDAEMAGVHPRIRKEREALRQCQLVREALRERDPWKGIDILQGRLIERTDQALHTAHRDAETIRVLREELNNILNAKPHEWDDPSDFVNWAKNRARYALQKIENP